MTETMRYLLGKLPNKMLVNIIIQNYESVFPDLDERKEAFHEMAVLIQAREVFLGKRDLEKFSEPFRSEVAEFLKNWDSGEKAKSSDYWFHEDCGTQPLGGKKCDRTKEEKANE